MRIQRSARFITWSDSFLSLVSRRLGVEDVQATTARRSQAEGDAEGLALTGGLDVVAARDSDDARPRHRAAAAAAAGKQVAIRTATAAASRQESHQQNTNSSARNKEDCTKPMTKTATTVTTATTQSHGKAMGKPDYTLSVHAPVRNVY